MKTKTIKTPTAELLIVELQTEVINSSYHIQKTPKGILIKDDTWEKFISNKYTLLGKPDEIREEDARELVLFRRKQIAVGLDDLLMPNKFYYETAKESLLSATEAAGVLWENPLPKPQKTNLNNSFFDMQVSFNDEVKFDEAELRTFDRSRTLIFVKN